MKYNMTKPCDDCPFLKVNGIRLTAGRIEEIAGGMLDDQGSTFSCHKTVDYHDRDDLALEELGGHIPDKSEQHCAGALIFAEKNGNATQMMRWMERVGAYKAANLMADKEAVDGVFDMLDDMLECAWGATRKRKKAKHA